MSPATMSPPERPGRLSTIPTVPVLRAARHPVQLADFPPRAHALRVGRSLLYRQGRLVVLNEAPGDLFNERADLGWT